jgi:hypothetical protein
VKDHEAIRTPSGRIVGSSGGKFHHIGRKGTKSLSRGCSAQIQRIRRLVDGF